MTTESKKKTGGSPSRPSVASKSPKVSVDVVPERSADAAAKNKQRTKKVTIFDDIVSDTLPQVPDLTDLKTYEILASKILFKKSVAVDGWSGPGPLQTPEALAELKSISRTSLPSPILKYLIVVILLQCYAASVNSTGLHVPVSVLSEFTRAKLKKHANKVIEELKKTQD
jgi:hypothetical protein